MTTDSQTRGLRPTSNEQSRERALTSTRPLECAGLTTEEANQRRKQFGSNLLPHPQRLSIWRRLLAQLVHFFAVMLWIAGGLAILAGMPQLGFAIFIIIIVNGLFAFIQEYRGEKAGEQLRDLLPHRVMVKREGKRQSIDAIELVPGDVVVLNAGDRISADLQLAQVQGLSVDTSTLTGESVPTTPQPGETVFAGTFALEGEAIGIVAATGGSTRLAQIARLTSEGQRPPSPLALELERLVRIVAFVAVAVGSVVHPSKTGHLH